MSNKIVCDECNVPAIHISTVDSRNFGPITVQGTQAHTETKQYKCLNGHRTDRTEWSVKDLLKK